MLRFLMNHDILNPYIWRKNIMEKSNTNQIEALLFNKWTKLIVGVLILFLVYKMTTDKSTPENLKRETSTIDWHTPNNDELLMIGRILGGNGITGCGSYFVGQYDGETKVACTRDGLNFIYYDIWEASEKVNRTPTEQYEKFNQPPKN